MPVSAAIVSTSLRSRSKTWPRRSVRSKVTVSRNSSWVIGWTRSRQPVGFSARLRADFDMNWFDSAMRSASTAWARDR